MAEWTKHDGATCPVEAGTKIDVRYRDGGIAIAVVALYATKGWRDAGARFWDTRDKHHSDIVAWRNHVEIIEG